MLYVRVFCVTDFSRVHGFMWTSVLWISFCHEIYKILFMTSVFSCYEYFVSFENPSPCTRMRHGNFLVLLHNVGFWNNCTSKQCLHAHIGAFPNKCTIKFPFHTTATWKVCEFMKTTSLCSVWRNKIFDKIILTQNHAGHITQSGWTY